MKEARFERIIRDIKHVKIQGATNIALAGIQAYLMHPDYEHAHRIFHTRPTEPLMQNCINILIQAKNPKKTAKRLVQQIKQADKKIAISGAKLIKKDMNIFTHCHSTTVIEILKRAKQQGKNFVVYNTETTPLFQGRQTAEELAKLKIPVIHIPDTAVSHALKKCNLFLFGSDAFLEHGMVNKIGTKPFCELAKLHHIPRYTAGISLKFCKHIDLEYRTGKEVWDERNPNIKVLNPAFDFIPANLISEVICESGIFHYPHFIKIAEHNLRKLMC
jgi:translation initiation factor eIF-2B subunit delta